jgi:polar amino acid transport system substrate-binding protein
MRETGELKVMRLLLRVVPALLALVLAPADAVAETWVAGSMDSFAPYNHTQDGECVGSDVQILDEAAASIGVTLEHHPLPWKRALLDFRAGNLDAVFQLAPTPERVEQWNMVGPLRRTRTVFVTRADSPLRDIATLDDLQGLVVGTVAGFTYDGGFDDRTDMIREASKDEFTNVRKLLLGRSDVIVIANPALNFVVEELNARDKLRILPTPLADEDRYIAFHRTPEGDLRARRLQQAIESLHASGRIQEIILSHVAR